MNYLDKYKLIFNGLPKGKHNFEFEIDNKFFEQFDFSEVQKGALTAHISANKMSASMLLEIVIGGTVTVQCDRCLDDLDLPVNFTGNLLINFTEMPEHEEENDEVMYVGRGEEAVNLAQYFYENIILSLPIKRVHAKKSQCNKEMIEKLNKIMIKEK